MSDLDRAQPQIDYLAKDYASFRRLMLDHLSLLVPDWREQSTADLGHALVEVLAYAADYLSYYQDAVATEAYLGTARLRRSVRRHVRPLEYYLQEGCNARAWVQIQVHEKLFLPIHTQLLTRLDGREGSVIRSDEAAYHQALDDKLPVFETMHYIYLMPHHEKIPILPRD
ncbi:MAG: putative baseplate assembly protein, partial [Anaerolineae bacterium]